MTVVLIILGSISIIYGIYLHQAHRFNRSAKPITVTENERNIGEKTKSTENIRNITAIGNKKNTSVIENTKNITSIESRKNIDNRKNIENLKNLGNKKKIEKNEKIIPFSEVLRENLSQEDLQKDTLEKLKNQSITLEEAAKILKMNKGEVLLLKNIYVNYHQ